MADFFIHKRPLPKPRLGISDAFPEEIPSIDSRMPLESPRKAADALFSEEAREVADEGLNRCTGFLEACTYSWNNLKETLMNFAGWLEGNVSMAKEEFIVLGVMVLGIIGFFLLGYGLVSWIIKKVCGNG